MSSIGFSYTPDLVPFLEIISDTVYIPKKQMPVMGTDRLLEGHGRAINVQNFELRYIDDCGVYSHKQGGGSGAVTVIKAACLENW